jgi:hypothetical protein
MFALKPRPDKELDDPGNVILKCIRAHYWGPVGATPVSNVNALVLARHAMLIHGCPATRFVFRAIRPSSCRKLNHKSYGHRSSAARLDDGRPYFASEHNAHRPKLSIVQRQEDANERDPRCKSEMLPSMSSDFHANMDAMQN